MSIESKIADLLEESAKLKALEETTEEKIEVVEEEVISEEEFDQLDEDEQALYEVSNATLGSYVKKATAVGAVGYPNTGYVPSESKSKEELDKEETQMRNLENRKKGISKAKEKMDVQEDVDALLYGEDLTEEFKVKAATIFEAAVMGRVNAEVATLEEAFDARLEEEAKLAKEEIIEKVDGYLNFIVEQWMSDNEIAIENGLKLDIFEGFVQGMKGLFEEHYIEVPEERFDVVGDLQEQVNFLESKLDESLETNVTMAKQLSEMARDSITDDFCTSMTDTEVEKFKALAEELSFESADSYTAKLQIIKENYFNRKPTTGHVDSVVTDSPVQLTEETNVNIDANVARYLETFNRIK